MLKINEKSEYPLIHSCLLTDISDEKNHLKIEFTKDYKNLKPLEFERIDLKDYKVVRGYDRIIYHENYFIIPQIDGSKTIYLKLECESEWNLITIKLDVDLFVFIYIIHYDLGRETRRR